MMIKDVCQTRMKSNFPDRGMYVIIVPSQKV